MKRELIAVTTVALLGLSMSLLTACAPNPYDTANCQQHCAGVMGNYQSYNWWKSDQDDK
jgi:hypothetical protein